MNGPISACGNLNLTVYHCLTAPSLDIIFEVVVWALLAIIPEGRDDKLWWYLWVSSPLAQIVHETWATST